MWKATGPKADFGFSELVKHVHETGPTTLFVGYGAETAFLEKEEQWADWQAGYRRLLDELAKTNPQMILLTPVRQEKHGAVLSDVTENNKRLERTSKFILGIARERGYRSVDNFCRTIGERRDDSADNSAYADGIHLNESGHQTLARFMVEDLGLPLAGYSLYYADGKDGDPSRMTISGGVATGQAATRRGFRLDARLDRLPAVGAGGSVKSPWPAEANAESPSLTVRIDGNSEVGQFNSGSFAINSGPDQAQAEELRKKINEKNQIHRYKLRPLNKAYIFLHRRHEMGHLAYELDDFEQLIAGHERPIAHLRQPRTHSYDIERVEPWKSPRDYPDHEVPKDIPKPDLVAELAAFTPAEGFEVNLFAANPMIANPINMNWDTRGRAWVSTSTTYPHIKPGRIPNDRIVIPEDTDQDGRADKHTVFAEGLLVPHSVMPVPGGAYVCSGTEFLFLADDDGDDVSAFALREGVFQIRPTGSPARWIGGFAFAETGLVLLADHRSGSRFPGRGKRTGRKIPAGGKENLPLDRKVIAPITPLTSGPALWGRTPKFNRGSPEPPVFPCETASARRQSADGAPPGFPGTFPVPSPLSPTLSPFPQLHARQTVRLVLQ